MNTKYLIILILFVFSVTVHVQNPTQNPDLIVTVTGDSLHCRIIDVAANEILFRFGTGSIIAIPNSDVASHQYNYSQPAPVQVTPVVRITAQPAANTNVAAGSITGSLTVSATATQGATPGYQWYRSVTNSNAGGLIITGETSASFTIPATLSAGTYYYFCEISVAGGVAARSNVATVNIQQAAPAAVAPVVVNTQPAATTAQPTVTTNESKKKHLPPFYLAFTGGKSAYGTVSHAEIKEGSCGLFGIDAAYFFSPYLGAGMKFNFGYCDVVFNEPDGTNYYADYEDVIVFWGPALFGRLGNKRVALTAAAGGGLLLWDFYPTYLDHDGWRNEWRNETSTSIGAMLSAGINFMLTEKFGIDFNVQSVYGTLKNKQGIERNPKGQGYTMAFCFRF